MRRTIGLLGLGVAAAASAAGCIPTAVTPQGDDISRLYSGFLIVAAVVAGFVIVPTTLAIILFRRRPDRTGLPVQREGHLVLELIWTGLPALTVVGLFIATYLVLIRVDATDAPATTEIEVTGYRWGWSFTYPRDGITIDGLGEPGPEIAVPIDEPITLRMTSADVIHSFYVPVFLFKRDANPGRETVFQFSVQEAGTYRGQCAEFCGLYHARMPFTVLAMERPAYDAWLASAQAAVSAGATPAMSPAAVPSSSP